MKADTQTDRPPALCSGRLLAALAARWERRAIHLETHVNYAPGGYPLRMARASLLRDCAKELRAEIEKAANTKVSHDGA